MVEAKGLHKSYRTGAIRLQVLKGVNVRIQPGEFVAITGPSGAGKSTLLHLLAGLDVPTAGQVLWEGRPWSVMSDKERGRVRNRAIGFVFQFYHLLPELSALENVMLPGWMDGQGTARLKERAQRRLKQVGLSPRAAHKPSQLSGGELQRVAIARAMINDPTLLVCDEPTGNLDSETGAVVAELLADIHRQQGTALVLVTHEEALAALAARRLILKDGQIVSDRTKEE